MICADVKGQGIGMKLDGVEHNRFLSLVHYSACILCEEKEPYPLWVGVVEGLDTNSRDKPERLRSDNREPLEVHDEQNPGEGASSADKSCFIDRR